MIAKSIRFSLAKATSRSRVHRIDGHAFGDLRDAGIARRAIELRHERARGERPGKRMLASARTDEKDVHARLSCWSRLSHALYHRRMMDETPLAAPGPQGNLPEFTVSELVEPAEAHGGGRVPLCARTRRGQPRQRHSSGHCYFDLKDDTRRDVRGDLEGTYPRLKVKPEQGLEVICTGRLTTYPGTVQLSAYRRADGAGRARRADGDARSAQEEARRRRPVRRRAEETDSVPARVVGVITSPTGAVIRDIMHRLADRCPRRVLLWPVTVQGERAPAEIAAAIRGFNALP